MDTKLITKNIIYLFFVPPVETDSLGFLGVNHCSGDVSSGENHLVSGNICHNMKGCHQLGSGNRITSSFRVQNSSTGLSFVLYTMLLA